MPHSNIACPSCGAALRAAHDACPDCGKTGPDSRRFPFRLLTGGSLASGSSSEADGSGDIIISTRDHLVLDEIVCLRMRAGDLTARILMEKLERGRIVPPEDMPADVVTLGARVVFSIDGEAAEARVLTHPDAHSVSAWSLPVTTPRGAALLGLRAGTATKAVRLRGGMERIDILSVIAQPENDRRHHGTSSVAGRGTVPTMLRRRRNARWPGQDDDPPPSAA